MHRPYPAWLVLLFALVALPAHAETLAEVFAATEAPPGIVFELLEDEEAFLDRGLPALQDEIQRIRERFPDLPIEIVSHGVELLALTHENIDFYPKAHRAARELHAVGIPIIICGAYAGEFEAFPEDFPDYDDVLPSGPAHINNLMALDYWLIRYP